MASRRYWVHGTVVIVMSTIFFYLFVLGIHRGLPYNAIPALPLERSLNVEQWFPQGWGFFSKNPRDPYFYVVNLRTGKSAVNWPNNSVSNLFGINRFGRAQGIEAGLLVNMIPSSDFVNTTENPIKRLESLPPALTIKNPSPSPTITGDIGFVYQQPVPWAWSKESNKIVMPARVVRVIVK